MSFDLMTLEVDGSLSNRVVLWVVVAGAVVLALVSAYVAYRWPERRRLLPLLAAAYLLTPIGQVFARLLAYRLYDPRVISVGFWGPPWLLLSTVAGLVTFTAVLLLFRRRSGLDAA
jgi:MFS family permease